MSAHFPSVDVDFRGTRAWLQGIVSSSFARAVEASTIITSNRPFEDWAKLLGDVVVVTPLLDRLMHHGHLLKFDGKSWRLKEAAARIAKRASSH